MLILIKFINFKSFKIEGVSYCLEYLHLFSEIVILFSQNQGR